MPADRLRDAERRRPVFSLAPDCIAAWAVGMRPPPVRGMIQSWLRLTKTGSWSS